MNELIVGTKLTATQAITDIVGSRIRPGVLFEGDPLPAIIYDLQSLEYDDSASSGELDSGQMQVDITCLSPDYLEAKNLRNRIMQAMQGWQDDTSNPHVNTAHVDSVVYAPDGANPGNDTFRHAFIVSVIIPFSDYTPE